MKFPIPQDWDGVSWCRWSVCWPASEGWEGFLRGLISLPQRGWTWDERTGSILDVQVVGREITAQNLPLNGVIMACNDESLANSFSDIAASIRLLATRPPAGGCCESPEIVINNSFQGGTSGGVGPDSTPFFGSEPGLVLTEGEIPEGSTDLESYNLEKCRNAHLLVDALIGSLNNLAGFEYGKSIALVGFIGVAIFSAIIFPPSIIPLMIGVLIVLAAEVTILSAAADYIQEHRDELICLLYTSDSTDVILEQFANFLEIMIGILGVTSPIGIAIKAVCLMLFNTDTVNRLFTSAASAGYADADCTCNNWWTCAIGTILASDSTSVTLESIDPGDFDQLVAVAYSDGSPLVELSAEVTGWIAPSDHPEFASSWHATEDACGGGLGFGWDNISTSPEVGPVEARTFQHRGNVVFTVKYTRIIP